jgi:peptide chain release factor 1
MAVLRARLYSLEQQKHAAGIAEQRKAQVGSGERSEKIRTYNFPQDRLTDHRINLTVHNLPAILAGQIDGIIEALAAADREQAEAVAV